MLVPGSCNDNACDSETNTLHTESMYGFAALVIMLIMSLFAIDYVRRKFFELFSYTHQLFRLVILFVCFHYSRAMLYLLPGVVLLVNDKAIGYISLLWTVNTSSHCLTGDIVELRVQKDPKYHCQTGQYVFVNVPAVSVLEWHPMTVTWTTETEFVLHIKSRGAGTWTQKLYEDVSLHKGITNVRLDGFYGPNAIEQHSLAKKDAILLVAEGHGLMFPFRIVTDLADTTVPVYLCWVTSTWEEYYAFQKLLLELKSRLYDISVSVWVTDGSTVKNGTSPPPVHSHFTPASTPYSSGSRSADFVTRGGGGQIPWNPFSEFVWPRYVHAIVTAGAILLGALGYAQSRKKRGTDADDTSKQPRALLVDRFLDLAFPVMMVGGMLCLLIGLRMIRYHRLRESCSSKVVHEAEDSTSFPSEGFVAAPTEEEDMAGLEMVEDGEVTLDTKTGARPDIPSVFEGVRRKHHKNVAVFACGEMVDLVKHECQMYMSDGWVMCEQEWEW